MRVAVAVAALALALAGCGAYREGEDDPRPFERFDEFPLYWVGEEFEGLDVDDEDPVEGRMSAREAVTFLYGECEPESDQGCALPLEIENYPACARGPRSYSGPGARPERRLRLRGVPAAAFELRLELYTRETTVVIFSEDAGRLRRAAHALRSVRGGIAAGDLLPRPRGERRRC